MDSATAHSANQGAVEVWQRWRRARRRRDRDKAAFELWQLCENETWGAASELAQKFGGARHVTVSEWRFRNGLSEDDIRYAAFPAVMEAAKGFDPSKGVRFQTYAYKFILGHIRRLVTTEDALSVAGELQDVDVEEEQPVEEEPHDMWYLLELNPDNGGPGQKSDLGTCLAHTNASPDELDQVREWLDENRERAIERYGLGRLARVAFHVRSEARVKRLSPELRHRNPFEGMSSVGPFQAVAIRADGEKWNLMLPVQADLLLRAGLKKSTVAKLLELPWSTFKDMNKRMKDVGFDSSRFTLDQTDAAVRGKPPGRPPKKPRT